MMLHIRQSRWLQCRPPSSITRASRCFGSVSHLTPAEMRLYFEHGEAKASLPPSPVLQKPPAPQFLRPQIHHSQSSTWVGLENNIQGLESGSVLKIVSWSLSWSSLGPAARASVALGHLRGIFGEVQDPLVVMFQDVRRESLQAILENSWVQRNFLLSKVDPPDSLYRNIPGNSFVLKRLDWSDWLRSVHLHPFTFCATAFSIHRSLFYDMGKKSPAKILR